MQSCYAQEPEWMPESRDVNSSASFNNHSNGRHFFDLAASRNSLSQGANSSSPSNAHANLALDHYLSGGNKDGVRWLISGRLDFDAAPGAGLNHEGLSLTLREAYLSSDFDQVSLDVGRITIRDGVALTFNPSDVFRVGSISVRRTEDPTRLRESRLGVLGAQLRMNTELGNFATLFAPGVTDEGNKHWYQPQFGAVNRAHAQWYVKYTPPRWQELYSNFVFHHSRDTGNTIAANLSRHIGQQWLAYMEWAAIKPSQPNTSVWSVGQRHQSYQQAALGASFTTEQRQTLSLEYQFNGVGLSRQNWGSNNPDGWQNASVVTLLQAYGRSVNEQSPLARHSLTSLLQWDQLFTPRDDLTCLYKFNVSDRSKLKWCEWRYKQDQQEWSVNLSQLTGRARSEFAALNETLVVGAKLRLFF